MHDIGDQVGIEVLYSSVKTEVKTFEFELQRAGDGVIHEMW